MARIGGIVRGAGGGLSRLAAALGGGGNVEQQAFDQTMAGQSKVALALAQMRAQEANAAKDYAAANETAAKTAALQQRPQTFQRLIAANSGTDVPNVSAFLKQLDTGTAGQVPMGPETADGSMGVGTAQFDPATASRITQQLQRFAPLATNTGDFKADDWAQALSSFRNSDLGDQVLNGQRTAGQVGASQAAAAGKPLFNADSTGAVLDLFGGKLATDNPMAGSTINLRTQQAGAQKANAVQSYAAANNSNASAAKTRAEMAEGTNRSGGKAPNGYRWGADGATLEPIPGGPADPNTKGAKLQRPPTEGQAKAIGFGSRMQVADEILNELADKGVSRPGAIKGVAETVGNVIGLGTDSMGGALADIAGTATNWTQSEGQQQVEQAQRDFINAILRRESGAAIGLGEFRNAAKQYFPQPGDDKKTLTQKAANRRVAINAMKAEFGEAYLPDFTRSVDEARAARGARSPAAARAAPPAQSGRNVTVDW